MQGDGSAALAKAFPVADYTDVVLGDDAHLFISKNDPWQKMTTADGSEIYFIGDVFYLDKHAPEKTDGHFVAIQSKPGVAGFKIFRNRNSHIGVYYAEDARHRVVFSALYRTQRKLRAPMGISLDGEALEDFFDFGFVTFGKTPFRQIAQLPFRRQLRWAPTGFSVATEEAVPIVEEVLANPRAMFDFFQERFAIWLRQASFRSIAVSGGLDSRFILSCLVESGLQRDITLHSRLHPLLDERDDRDVFLAKQAAAITGYPHAIQPARDMPTAFLSQEAPSRPTVLSGLYGGEYVGGDFLALISLAPVEKTSSDSQFATRVRARRETVALEDDVELKMEILAQSSMCSLYDGAWVGIAVHHNLTLSPFLDTYCLEVISRLRAEQLRGYAVYRGMYEYFPEALRAIPLNSQIQIYHEDLRRSPQGHDPKKVALPGPPPVVSPVTREMLPVRRRDNPPDEVWLRRFQNFLQIAEVL